MFYLLYGTDEYLIKKNIKKITEKIETYNINEYDLMESNLKNILDDAFTISLFSNNRITIINNSYIFTSATNKPKQDTKILEKYLTEKSENIIIFICNEEKLDSRKKIVSLIEKQGKLINCNKTNIQKEVLDMFGNYKINMNDINFLIDRVGDNLYILEQEINKLKIYKDRNYDITKEDIINVTVKSIDIDIFHLIENIINKNKEKALESYYEMIKRGEEPIKIIVMLANQYRLIYQVKVLKNKRMSIYDMINILGKKKYPIELALAKSNNFTLEELINNLSKLADLDYNIKSGKVDKKLGLEMFILEN